MRPCFTFVFRWKEGRKEEGKNGETRAKRRGTGSATRPDLFLDDAPLQTPIPSFQSRSVFLKGSEPVYSSGRMEGDAWFVEEKAAFSRSGGTFYMEGS